MANPASRSTSRRTRLQRRRLSWRVAQGAPLHKAAERAGVDGETAEALLACPDFAGLVDSHRAMAELPVEERERRLIEAALLVLEDAIARHDLRATLFIFKQRLLGRSPSRELVKGVMRALERRPSAQKDSADPDDPAIPPPFEPAPRRPVPAVDRAAYGAAAAMREDILDEAEMLADVPCLAGCAPPSDQPGACDQFEKNPEGIIWSRDNLEKIEDLGALLHHNLSERQLMLIADVQLERERSAQTGRTGEPAPETDPNNPNAPNN